MYVPYSEVEDNLYATDIPSHSYHVAETKFPYLYWTERHLQVMWWEQKYFKNLKTSENLSIEVISPGHWNAKTGPDFLNAHLRIGQQEIRGDIEIHLDSQSWLEQKIHQDSSYDRVVLHLSLWQPHNKKSVYNTSNELIHQAYFENFLTISQTRILQLIDLDQYPCRKFLGGSIPIKSHHVFSEESVPDPFRSAAEWKLSEKAQYLKGHIEDQRLLLAAGISIVLGSKNNSESFFELFLRLLKYKDKTEEQLLSLALGMCGFFTEKHKDKWKKSTFYNSLLKIYKDLPYLPPHAISINLNKVRPLNHPIRRMAYLVKLIKDPLMSSLYQEIYLCWHQHWPAACLKKEWADLRQLINDRLPTYTDTYWNYHQLFENELQKQPISLFGSDLKEAIIVNTVLPLLYVDVMQKNNASEMAAFREFYRSFPACSNGKAHDVSHRFFDSFQKEQFLNKATAQQGAFQVYEDLFGKNNDSSSYMVSYKKIKTKKG